jgi:hypothetical protein
MTSHTSDNRRSQVLHRRLVIVAIVAAILLCILCGAAVAVTAARSGNAQKPATAPSVPSAPSIPSTRPPETEPLPTEPLDLPASVELKLGTYLVGTTLTPELLVSGLEGTGITARLDQPL